MPRNIVTGKWEEIKLNTHELAWAAGFFDGEGCSYCHKYESNPNRNPTLNISVTQKHKFVLRRFRQAVLGKGTIYRSNTWYQLMFFKFEETQAVMALLWKFLSPVKKQQFRDAVKQYHSLYKEKPRRGWGNRTTSPATVNAVKREETLSHLEEGVCRQ